MEYPQHCLQCKLYLNAKSWCIPPEYDSRSNLSESPVIVVVGQAPGFHEDLHNRPFCPVSGVRNAASFLRPYLEALEVRWVLDNAVRCYPGRGDDGRDISPTESQIRHCADVYLHPLIADVSRRNAQAGYQHTAVVCLGERALRAVMGRYAPRSLSQATLPIRIEGTNILVLGTWHPVNHIVGRKDLRNEYVRVFSLAERIALGQYQEEDVPYQVLRNPDEAYSIFRSITAPTVYLDCEVAVSQVDPQKKTFWHSGARILCVSFTFCNGANRSTYVIAPPAINADVILAAVSDRKVCAHNILYDAQALWIFTGVDIFQCSREIYDTMVAHYAIDQSSLSNGLKPLLRQYRNIPDWSVDVWEQVRRLNLRIQEENAVAAREARRKKESFTPRPLNADLGDVDQQLVWEYCAKDTHYTAILGEDVLPNLPQPDPLVLRLMHRIIPVLSRIERHGLPVDETVLDKLLRAHERYRNTIREQLCGYPEVQSVLQSGETITGHGYGFFAQLLRATDCERFAERTKLGRYRSNKEFLRFLAEDSSIPERARAIWKRYLLLRESEDLQSKFLEKFREFLVPCGGGAF